MRKLPYIEPTIRTVAGAVVTIAGALLYFMPDLQWLGLVLILFVSLNLLTWLAAYFMTRWLLSFQKLTS